MLSRAFLRTNFRWLLAGFVLTFGSSFGQTFFIALFAGDLRAAFDLSHGEFGGLYAAATLASAFLLVWVGKVADRQRLMPVALIVLAAFALVLVLMSVASDVWMLLLIFFGLRFLGQGMMSHIAITAMGRWFDRERGRSVSIAGLGYTAGEAVLPLIAVALMATIGWRMSWLSAAIFTVLIVIPLIWLCLRREPEAVRPPDDDEPIEIPASSDQATISQSSDLPSATDAPILRRQGKRAWTRRDVLGDPVFYVLCASIMSTSFIVTGIFFNQVHLADSKGWTMNQVALSFSLYAGIQIFLALGFGAAIDRFTAVRLLPGFLLPLGAGMLIIGLFDGSWALYTMMLLVAITTAGNATIQGAIWAELYGVTNLGSIRALTTACMVFFSAASPGMMGILIDAGVTIDTQAIAMAAYTLLASVVLLLLQPRLRSVASDTRLPPLRQASH